MPSIFSRLCDCIHELADDDDDYPSGLSRNTALADLPLRGILKEFASALSDEFDVEFTEAMLIPLFDNEETTVQQIIDLICD